MSGCLSMHRRNRTGVGVPGDRQAASTGLLAVMPVHVYEDKYKPTAIP